MDDLLSEFLTETAESLEVIDSELVRFEAEPNDQGILNNVFRLVHTIKGTCGFLGLPRLEAVAHAGETLLGKFRDGTIEVTPPLVTLVLESIDQIKALLAHLENHETEPEGSDADLIGRLEDASEGKLSGAAPAKDETKVEAKAEAADSPKADESAKKPRPDNLAEDVRWDEDLGRELRPGEVSLAELEAAFASVEVEDFSNPPDHDEQAAVEAEPVEEAKPAAAAATSAIDAVADIAADLAANDTDAHPGAPRVSQSIRVNVDVLEHLMNMVSELVLTRNQLLQMVRTMDDSEFKTPLQRLSNVTGELQDAVMQTRMQPIGNAWKKIPRIVRDASHDLNKKIKLVMEGDQTELDRQVLELIRDPLTHMIRNSCDHAIELPSDRLAVGKPEEGTITLRAFHEGGHIIIELNDDGAGLRTARIRQKAIENGVISADEADSMTEQQIHRLIFAPGFSTAEKVTNLSGRGVGMDVVRTNIELIGGAVDLVSREGEGTTFAIKIPLTLAIVSALIVGARGQRFAVPQLSVVELVRTGSNSDNRIESINGTKVLRLRDRLLPVMPLSSALKLDAEEDEKSNRFVIVMQVASQRFGLVVDEVFDTEEIVVKPISSVLRDVTEYSGSTILGDGSVIMILDPNGISKLAAFDKSTAGAKPVVEQAKKSVARGEKKTSLLVFSAGAAEPKACPLSLVTRLEEIEVDRFEMTNKGPVVQYRGQLMPVIPMSGSLMANEEGRQPVLVVNNGDSVVGIGVDRVLDITEDVLRISIGDESPGVLGTAVIDGKATEVIDIGHFLSQVDFDWAEAMSEGPKEPKSLLLFESHDFFRNMLAPLLEASGYRVTTVSSAEEAIASDIEPSDFDVVLADIDNDAEARRFMEKLSTDADWGDVPRIAMSNNQSKLAAPDFAGCVRKSDRHGLLAVLDQTASLKGQAA
ncbi:chemotaxis protein CheW [Ponticaulis sp.]|uniref:hybrid sensor histidine kinase/response regulator n=1 Tax=Ponticaulis sp. TaxID=2020902 RepID=UPI000B63A42A|nr:chemotaxis protein CheW [Ponticaulis sp.]MAI90503.1 hybrid sensor histidine kinase/response regulator [Ponticaulis sp.]OUY00198.1 MAG: hybrid sensor histidine kinase/response regulator [Hyphomonadaceae bacterium TMED5]|tara:strand:+ start:129558 stop:132338 length:2781 start_codon:yes stop_codon:yes gene_type:complete